MNAWHQSIERMEYFLLSAPVSVPGLILKCILAERGMDMGFSRILWGPQLHPHMRHSSACLVHRQISLEKNQFSGLLPVGSVTSWQFWSLFIFPRAPPQCLWDECTAFVLQHLHEAASGGLLLRGTRGYLSWGWEQDSRAFTFFLCFLKQLCLPDPLVWTRVFLP